MDSTVAGVDPPDPLGKGSKGWTPPWQWWTPTRTPWGRGPMDGPHRGRGGPLPGHLGEGGQGMRPHPPFVGRRSSEVFPRAAGGPVTALAFFDGWVIPTVKKGHAFRLGQGMGPTVAGVAPIRPPWGRGPRDAPPSAPTPPPCAPIPPPWGEGLGRPSPVLEGVWQVCHTSGRSSNRPLHLCHTSGRSSDRPSPGGRGLLEEVKGLLEEVKGSVGRPSRKCGRGRGY